MLDNHEHDSDAASAHEAAPSPEAGQPAENAPVEKPANAPKRLLSGRDAAAKLATTYTPVGVATQRITESPTRRVAEPVPTTSDEDLPMYREGMDWFVLRVASNKESGVRETLLRKVAIEGMEHLVGRIMVPTEKIKTFKAG
ncbi:MAG: hypothetical protein ACO3NL_15490, partial [Phycisphaerales bacterium]